MKQVFLISMLFLACLSIKVQPTDSLDPEFADIDPFLNGSQLTPKAAAERMLNMLKRVERLEDRLVSHLKLVKEYVSYHHMPPGAQRAVTPSWDSQADFFDLSDYNNMHSGGMNDEFSNSSSVHSSNDSRDSLSSQSVGGTRSGTRYSSMNSLRERKLNDNATVNIVDLVRQAQALKPKDTPQQSVPLDHPMLHNYGNISKEEASFNELKTPTAPTSNENQQVEKSSEAKEVDKPAAQLTA
jgi:hypothetical protein